MKRNGMALLLLWIVLGACTQSSSGVSSSRMKEVVASSTGPLRVLAQPRGILIGTAVNMDALHQDATYASTLAREFDVVTPENVMKFDATEPAPGIYTFTQGDALVSFAQTHQMQVHGHNLVWHQALPNWITQGTFTRDQLLAILKQHVQTVVSHYKGQLNMWDVVNEAVNEDGTIRTDVWERVIGPDYIDLAFQWAHEADPQVHLFYNDYGAEGLGAKSNGVYSLVKGMVQRGVPIYGVGLQMHITIDQLPPSADVMANMQRLTALGLKVQITEMDVQVQVANDTRSLADRLAFQARTYSAMLTTCLEVKSCESFSMWGFTDRYTWIPQALGHPDEPLIFDMSYHPKPAYTALVKVLTT